MFVTIAGNVSPLIVTILDCESLLATQFIVKLALQFLMLWQIDYCVAGCMTRYLPWEKLSPLEALEVLRALSSVLSWLPRETIFSAIDNGSYTPLRSQ